MPEWSSEFGSGASNMGMSGKLADLASIIAVIERSQIVVTAIPVSPAYLFRRFCLPVDFEAVDVAVLEWIVAQRPAVSSARTGWSNFATATNRVLQGRAS
jgi:hypothetical protein